MNENEFELDGVEYVAEDVSYYTCEGCVFYDIDCNDVPIIPMCSEKRREDKRNVVFKLKKLC
jgi:hypothetical protein